MNWPYGTKMKEEEEEEEEEARSIQLQIHFIRELDKSEAFLDWSYQML